MAIFNTNPKNGIFQDSSLVSARSEDTIGDLQDAVYTTIKSSPAMLEMLFSDMFRIAKTYLGESKRKTFGTLEITFFGHTDGKEDWAKSKIKKAIDGNLVVITPEGKHNNKNTITVIITPPFNWSVSVDAIQEINGMNDRNFYTTDLSQKHNEIIAVLFGEYWEEMLSYAKKYQHYSRQWQSLAAA